MLALLTVIFAFNFVDRIALGIMLQDIKLDLSLSDTQLGLLSGVAFALFYAVMGIPIARWADRGNRVTIISFTAVIWSAMVALCGLASNFVQLVLIRIGVGVGEAGCIPPAQSLIADYFSRAERPRASAIYALGSPLASLIGFGFTGWFNQLYGWRNTFIVLGVPGLVLALLAWFTLKEPRRQASIVEPARRPAVTTVNTAPGLMEVGSTLWVNFTFRHLVLSFAVVFLFAYGITMWQPTFFIRSYGLTTGEVGSWLAVICGLGGLVGTYLGGALATRYAANNEALQLRGIAIATLVCGVLSAFVYVAPGPHSALGFLAAAVICGTSAYGPLLGTIQTLVPADMRATAIALVYFFANLIGMGLGPLATGALSDAMRVVAAEDSLRYALLSLCPGYAWAAWHLWQASGTVHRDLNASGTGMG